jgi:hypothetical protein
VTKQGEPEIDPITLSQFDFRENRIELNFLAKHINQTWPKCGLPKFFCGPAGKFNAVCVHNFVKKIILN